MVTAIYFLLFFFPFISFLQLIPKCFINTEQILYMIGGGLWDQKQCDGSFLAYDLNKTWFHSDEKTL